MLKEFIFFNPPLSEILVIVGSFGVVLAVYKILETLLSVSKILEH